MIVGRSAGFLYKAPNVRDGSDGLCVLDPLPLCLGELVKVGEAGDGDGDNDGDGDGDGDD